MKKYFLSSYFGIRRAGFLWIKTKKLKAKRFICKQYKMKNPIFRDFTEKQYIRGIAWQKRGGEVFLRGVDTPMHTMSKVGGWGILRNGGGA